MTGDVAALAPLQKLTYLWLSTPGVSGSLSAFADGNFPSLGYVDMNFGGLDPMPAGVGGDVSGVTLAASRCTPRPPSPPPLLDLPPFIAGGLDRCMRCGCCAGSTSTSA